MGDMVLAIDARTGFDALQGEGSGSDKRTALVVAAIREALLEPDSSASVRWLPGPQHTADGLTKFAGNGVLEQVACQGLWPLRDCAEVREERGRVRQQRRAWRRPSPFMKEPRPHDSDRVADGRLHQAQATVPLPVGLDSKRTVT